MPSPNRHWRSYRSAQRRYDTCRCHAPAAGHMFNRDLVCHGCGIAWTLHQTARQPCPRPVDHKAFRPLAGTKPAKSNRFRRA